MDYTKLPSLRCVVDWIEIAFKTRQRTNLQAMRDRCGLASVFAFDDETGQRLKRHRANQGTTRFSFRVQAPRNWDVVAVEVERVQRIIAGEYGLAAPPEVIGVEVALDIKAPGADRHQLAEIIADLYAGQTYVVSDNHRMYKDFRGSGKAIPGRFASLVRDLADGFQIGIGDEDADLYTHLYLKDHDNGGKDELKPKDWRARYEVRIQGAALPSRDLSYWAAFDFTRLNKPDELDRRLFNFGVMDSQDPMIEALAAIPEMRQRLMERRRRPRRDAEGRVVGYTFFRHDTKASPVNKRIDSALRRLSERWAPKSGTSETARAWSAAPSVDCGNFSGLDPKNPHKHWEVEAKHSNYTEEHLVNKLLLTYASEGSELNNSPHNDGDALRLPPSPVEDITGNTITDHGSRCSQPIADDDAETVMNCDTGRAGEGAPSAPIAPPDTLADLETLFPEFFNLMPELEMELARIDRLMEEGGPPPPLEAKS